MISYDIVIIGGGPAGLAAAVAARKAGIEDVANGCPHTCGKTIPASFVQRSLHTK